MAKGVFSTRLGLIFNLQPHLFIQSPFLTLQINPHSGMLFQREFLGKGESLPFPFDTL